MNPTYHFGPVVFPLGYAQQAPDGYHLLERLGDHQQWTTRFRAERVVLTPAASVDALIAATGRGRTS